MNIWPSGQTPRLFVLTRCNKKKLVCRLASTTKTRNSFVDNNNWQPPLSIIIIIIFGGQSTLVLLFCYLSALFFTTNLIANCYRTNWKCKTSLKNFHFDSNHFSDSPGTLLSSGKGDGELITPKVSRSASYFLFSNPSSSLSTVALNTNETSNRNIRRP